MTVPQIRRRRVPVPKAKGEIRAPSVATSSDSLFAGLHWSPAYVAFLVYIFVITSYRFPLGTASMVTALVLLPLEKRPLRMPPVLLWAIAFLGWAFVGWGTSAYPNVVWLQVNELAKICGVMLVAVNVLTTRARLRFFILAFLGFFAFYPVRGSMFAYFIYGGTYQGRAAWNYIYSNPNDLAALCILPLALAAGMLFTERQRWIRYCAAAGAVALPFVILLTESRGAFIALAMFAIVIVKGQKKRRGAILLTVLAVGVVVYFFAPDSLWKRLGTLSDVTNEQSAAKADDDLSARQRLELWKVARTIAVENPVTGVGLGAYPEAHYVTAQRPNFDPLALGHRDPHSTYLSLLAETGVVGFCLFFIMVGTTVREAELTRRRAKLTNPSRATQLYYMEVGLFGYFVAGIWGSYSMMVLTYLYLVVMYAATEMLKAELPPLAASARRHLTSPDRTGITHRHRVAS
jgi:probable O-glycosylation ligase (exosortase A-associated)